MHVIYLNGASIRTLPYTPFNGPIIEIDSCRIHSPTKFTGAIDPL